MSNKIIFIVPYPINTAPSQRLKFEQYYTDFELAGYQITHCPFISDDFWKIIYKKGFYWSKLVNTIVGYFKRFALLTKVRKCDIVYVHLWGTPFGFPIYEWCLRRFSKKLIYDIDDLIYQGSSSPNNSLAKFLKSSWKVDFLMKNADQVLVSTDRLVNYAGRFTTKITVVPATIDVKKYNLTKITDLDKIVIGWSGSHTTSKYLHLLDDVFKQILAQHNNVKIMVMGDKDYRADGVDIELINWTAETEINSLYRFDIGIHPVPDEEWVYGKSGGKLVQYMAAGLPIVASAIGPNFKAINNGYNGFLVKTDQEWIEKLELLISDAALRKQMGINSKQFAVTHYSVEANLHKYLAAFK